jgi:predicted Fe-Mo cluster-binding NifX family protein
MKIAIPQWKGRVSPLFDEAREVLLFDVSGGRKHHCEGVTLIGNDPFERARSLRRHGAQLLICGAISHPLEMALISTGVQVISFTCGRIDDVLKAFLNGQLNEKRFLMPGCESRQRQIRNRQSQRPQQ